jgi:transposase
MLAAARRARMPCLLWSAVEPVTKLVQGRGTSDCRCEHEPQNRLPPRSLLGESIIDSLKEEQVDQIHDRVAGLDVHRDGVTACFRHLGPRGGVIRDKQQFTTTTAGLSVLAEWLADRQVELVVMESTGVYWKPVYYALEHRFTVWLCNARHVKKVPGRKTDLSDAEWLADVAAHGMVRPSFVPPPPIRELRELTRYRKTQIDARVAEIQRLEKVLQDAGIKLTSVASKVLTKSGRDMIEALIAGQQDPAALADLAKGKMRRKIPALTEALTGHFRSHHAVACRQILEHVDFFDDTIAVLTEQINARTAAFDAIYRMLSPIPGLDRLSIDVIVAETGADMSRFPTAGDLASWAGVCPGNHESAGKRRRVRTTHGNQWLRRALVESARSAVRTKGSYFGAQYRQIARRRGPNKAAVAVAHSLTELIWHILSTGEVFHDLGQDYFHARHDPQRQARRLVSQLENLGFTVTITAA